MDTTGNFRNKLAYKQYILKLRFTINYRDVKEIMRIRGVEVDHATIQRWVYKFMPEIEIQMRKRKKIVGVRWLFANGSKLLNLQRKIIRNIEKMEIKKKEFDKRIDKLQAKFNRVIVDKEKSEKAQKFVFSFQKEMEIISNKYNQYSILRLVDDFGDGFGNRQVVTHN